MKSMVFVAQQQCSSEGRVGHEVPENGKTREEAQVQYGLHEMEEKRGYQKSQEEQREKTALKG